MSELQLGKLESIHPTSPVYLQRAAILAVLSFGFFLAMLVAFSFWRNFIYFLLSTAFLIVQLFTLFGWFTQRNTQVKVYENGFKYKKQTLLWDEIESIAVKDENQKSGCEIKKQTGGKVVLTEAIQGIDTIIGRIKTEIARR